MPALSAPDFILALLDSAPNVELRAADLVAAAVHFDIDASAMRVALARFAKQGVVRALSRGVYGVGQRGRGVHHAVLAWADAERALKSWDGGWLAIHPAQRRRSSKAALRAHARALRLKGFKAADPGLAVRPANLRADLARVREELVALGLDPDARTMLVREWAPAEPFASLWDRAELEANYRAHLDAMQHSAARLDRLNPTDAARETLLIGRAVTRDIVLDPLLPREMVDAELRGRMIKEMRRYDRLGKRCWRNFYATIGRGAERIAHLSPDQA